MARLVRRSLGEGGRAASYGAAVLHTPTGVLHIFTFSDEALLRFTAQYEASPLRSDMKHSLRSYD